MGGHCPVHRPPDKKITPRAGQFGLETLSNWMDNSSPFFYVKNMRPLFLAILLLFSGTQQGTELVDSCEMAKQNFDSCNDRARATFSGFGCNSACDFVTSLASCLDDLSSSCPEMEEVLLKKTKKLMVRMGAANPNWDETTCPGALDLKKKHPSLDCSEADKEFTKCHAEAYNTYQTQLSHGGDGRPDFLERKTCNWITETFQTCHDNIVATRCKTHYDLNAMGYSEVDGGLHSILTNLAATQPDWDSSLCPTASAHLVRWEEGREAREERANMTMAASSSFSLGFCKLMC